MTISQSAEYALRAVVWLAAHANETLSTLAIAQGTRVPAGYLSKVLQGLARAGIVQSCPGRSGGFVLARPPAGMTVLDVVNAVDPLRRIHACPLGIESHEPRLCPLHRSLDQVTEFAERAFHQTTIAQLLIADNARPPLCDKDSRRVQRRACGSPGSADGAAAPRNRRVARSLL